MVNKERLISLVACFNTQFYHLHSAYVKLMSVNRIKANPTRRSGWGPDVFPAKRGLLPAAAGAEASKGQQGKRACGGFRNNLLLKGAREAEDTIVLKIVCKVVDAS